MINIYGEEISLQYEGRLGCYRVCVTENISIQPRPEKVIRGCIKDIEKLKNNDEIGIIEPCENFLKKELALVGKTLVKGESLVPVIIDECDG